MNSFTTSYQGDPAVATDANGDFIVVWETNPQDGNFLGIFGRRFSAAGVAKGTEFQVNSYTTGFQRQPSIAADTSGDFIVVWQSFSFTSDPHDGSDYGIFGQRFDATGLSQGTEFQVNTYTTDRQIHPAVASDANGNFVVVWGSGTFGTQDGSSSGVFGQRFSSSGTREGTEFQVNTYTTNDQETPVIATSAGGDFVVTWAGSPPGAPGLRSIFGQRFSSAGAALGTEFKVSVSPAYGNHPSMDSTATGAFVVVWQTYNADGNQYGVFGQRYSSTGVALGTGFRVNSYTTASQDFPSVSSDADGAFVVVWQSQYQDGSTDYVFGGTYGIFAQRFDAAGTPDGSEFQVNTYTTNTQESAAVASNSDGDFVVVWHSKNQDGAGYGVFGQRYGDLIFQDGFESGDLTRWSSAATDGGDLAVSAAAAMAGTIQGLAAVVDDTNSLFVEDDTPSGESRYRARFYFDPNGFDPGTGSGHLRARIFIAFDSLGQRAFTLVLRKLVGVYSLRARVRLDDGTRADTPFIDITDGAHFVEVDWQRASAAGANDGQFTLQVDDLADAELTGLDNDESSVESVRIGALSLKSGAAGTLFFDQFESRRERFIGPE